jgi:hypothetical protein
LLNFKQLETLGTALSVADRTDLDRACAAAGLTIDLAPRCWTLNATMDAVRSVPIEAMLLTSVDFTRDVVVGCGLALVARDLINGTFMQAHYGTLTELWRKTIGRIHPDDIALLNS